MKHFVKFLVVFVIVISSITFYGGSNKASAATFNWPVDNGQNYITAYFLDESYYQQFGWQHYGIDIALGGTVPIKASAAGTITRNYYSSSYGNTVFIQHQINGKTFETVYAHLKDPSSLTVGQTVSQGQTIGYMGSTGVSTGQHLHFELHNGTWNVSKSNAVDPLTYLGKNLETENGWDDSNWHTIDPVVDGQVGWLMTVKPINKYKKVNGTFEYAGVLEAGKRYRVYGFNTESGPRYSVGGGEYVTQMEGYVEYRDAPVLWDGIAMFPGEIGRIDVVKPINVYTRDGSNLELNRIAQPGDLFRVFGYDSMHGGQYHIGNGLYVTNMPDYINYRTPSKELIDKAARLLGSFPKK